MHDENDENEREEGEDGSEALSGTVVPAKPPKRKTRAKGLGDVLGVPFADDSDEDEDEPAPRAVAASPRPAAAAATAATSGAGPKRPSANHLGGKNSKQLLKMAARHLNKLVEESQELQDAFDAIATSADIELMQKQIEKANELREETAKGAALLAERHKEAGRLISVMLHRDQRMMWEEQTRYLEKLLDRVAAILAGRGDPEIEARKKLYTLDEARRLLGAG